MHASLKGIVIPNAHCSRSTTREGVTLRVSGAAGESVEITLTPDDLREIESEIAMTGAVLVTGSMQADEPDDSDVLHAIAHPEPDPSNDPATLPWRKP